MRRIVSMSQLLCRVAVWAVFVALLAAAAVSGSLARRAMAQQPAGNLWKPARPAPRFVSYLPDDCVAILRVSLVELARHPASRPIYEAIKSNPGFQQAYGISAAEVRDMMFMWHGRSLEDFSYRRVFFLRGPIPAERIKASSLGKSQIHKLDDLPYGVSPGGLAWSMPDAKTLVFDGEASLKRWYVRRHEEVDPPTWLDDLPKLSVMTIAVAGDPQAIFAIARQDRTVADELAPYEPLAAATSLVAGVAAGDRLTLHAIVESPDVVASARLEQAANDLHEWIKTMLEQGASGKPANLGEIVAVQVAKRVAPLTGQLVASAQITRAANRVELKTSAPFDVTTCRTLVLLPQEFLAQLIGLDEKQRGDLVLQASAQKLLPLVVGMHRYHRQHGHFPPAVGLGPDGKTPHSWRVAILPFLDETDLYEQYKLDEPWDSPHNRTLLQQAPDVLRGPKAEPESVNTSYFVFTGEGTVFADDAGTKIEEVTDGASQTMMIVETERDVPWTKPVDIPFDGAKPFPLLGGIHENLFLTTFVDGTIRGFPPTYDQAQLKAAATRSGGEDVKIPAPPQGK